VKKTVLITGSAKGIGKAIALELAGSGYDIVINYLTSETEAYALQKQIVSSYGVRSLVCQADVSKEEEVDRMVSQIEEELGGVDVVGAWNCARRVYKHMLEQEWGRIVNISSTNGINTYYPMSFDYDASKAALISLTHDLAFQFAPYVNVNAVAPGFIGTESELDGYDEAFLKEETEKIMVKRYGKPEEVAYLVRFLISPEADFINNAVIRIDGGQYGSC